MNNLRHRDFVQPRIFFKHVYAGNPHEWGVLAFPNSQSPSKALTNYTVGDLVFLAITKDPAHHLKPYRKLAGQVFAVCTLWIMDRAVSSLANPKLVSRYPEFSDRWHSATSINEYWSFDHPISYGDIPDQPFLDNLRLQRGQLIDMTRFPTARQKLLEILDTSPKKYEQVYRSEQTGSHSTVWAQMQIQQTF